MFKCGRCAGDLPLPVRSDALYCSTRCRVAAHRASKLPARMRSADRWVRYSDRKVPLLAQGPWTAASSTDPATWTTFAEARKSTRGAGVGFVLNGDGIVCLDLDHCLTEGSLTREAAALLAKLPRTYIETSPSGHGLHVWGRGSLPRGFRRAIGGVHVEGYGTGRYITVTENVFRPGPLADLGGFLASLL